MLYKHWKKVLLSLTAFFWASCDTTSSADDGSDTPPIDNPDPRSSSVTGGSDTSSSSETPKSSAEAKSSAEEAPSSSSSAEAAASSDSPNAMSSDAKSSSSLGPIVAPKYGVPMSSSMVAAKYGVLMSPTMCEKMGSELKCDDGVTCVEEETETTQTPKCSGDQLCAKYGVVVVKDTTYKCDDGKTYSYAEFRSKYEILDGAVDLYGCPSDICGSDTVFEEVMPLYGIPSGMTDRPN